MVRRLTLLYVLAAVTPGCRETIPTQLVVVVQTDLDVPTACDALAIRVDDRAPPGDPFPASGRGFFPASFGVRPRGGDASRAARIEVTALSAGTAVVTQRALTTFVPDVRMRLDLYLSARCAGVVCDQPDQTCSFGRCVDARVPSTDLRPYEPGDPALDAGPMPEAGADAGLDAATDAEVDAGDGVGVGGLCSDDAACEPELMCSDEAGLPPPGTCLTRCATAIDCGNPPGDAVCMSGGAAGGACSQPCDPRGVAGQCAEGTRCTILSVSPTTGGPPLHVTVCVRPGTGLSGELCETWSCAAPYQCISYLGQPARCRTTCVGADECTDEAPNCYRLEPHLVIDGVEYSVCQP